MAVTAAITTAVAATASVGLGVASYEASQSAAAAEKTLAGEQKARLTAQQNEAAAEAARQATTGSTFGFSSETADTVKTGFGFASSTGAGPAASSANTGRGQITGFN